MVYHRPSGRLDPSKIVVAEASKVIVANQVRHKDPNFDLEALRNGGWLDTYQKYQSRSVFDGCNQIVVFLGEKGLKSRFVGVYDVGERRPAAEVPLPPGCPLPPDFVRPDDFYYPLDKRGGFEDLEDRLVIEWEPPAVAFNQWFGDRKVVEIQPPGAGVLDTETEEPVAARDMTFALERDLQKALRTNIEQLESGLRVSDGGKERTTDAGRIDITASDASGTTVAIELKAGIARPEALTQLLAYVGVIASEEQKPARGILVAEDFHPQVVFGARAVSIIQLWRYRFKFTFEKCD